MKKYIKKIVKRLLRPLLNEIKSENHIKLSGNRILKDNLKIEGSSLVGDVEIGENSVILFSKVSGNIQVSDNCRIETAKLSGNIKIGANSKFINGVEVHGHVEIGRYTSLNGPNTDIRSAVYPIIIGSFCSIARNVTFQEYNHDFSQMTSYFINTNLNKTKFEEDIVSKGPIEIGHDVWIGTHCVILGGISIGTGAVIAANSVVTGDIPPYAIAAGTPAKVIKYRFTPEKIDSLLASQWWDKPEKEILELFTAFKLKSNANINNSTQS